MARPKGTPKPKANNAESAKRTNDIYKMMLVGASRGDIIQFVAEKWQLTESMADEYISKANEILQSKIEQSQDTEFNRALQRREMLFQKCMTVQDYKAALSVEIDRSKLLKLYPATKTDITIKDESLTDEQRANRIAELLESARARRDRQTPNP